MEYSWNPSTKCTEKPQSSILKHPLPDVPFFQKYLKPQLKTKKLVNSVVYHPCLSRLAWGIYPFIFFKLLRVLSLSKILVEFSLTCTFHHVWENFFSLWCWKCIETLHFYSCTSHPLKTPDRIFWKCVSPKTKGVDGGNYDLLYQNSIRKNEDDFLYFVWSIIFLNMMALQFCE